MSNSPGCSFRGPGSGLGGPGCVFFSTGNSGGLPPLLPVIKPPPGPPKPPPGPPKPPEPPGFSYKSLGFSYKSLELSYRNINGNHKIVFFPRRINQKGAEISKWRFSDMRRCALGGFRPVEFESEVKN